LDGRAEEGVLVAVTASLAAGHRSRKTFGTGIFVQHTPEKRKCGPGIKRRLTKARRRVRKWFSVEVAK
jgi:hypothetical protein